MHPRTPSPAAALLLLCGLSSIASASPLQELALERDESGTLLRLAGGEAIHETLAEVQDARLLKAPDGQALVVLWNEIEGNASTPFYAIDLDGADPEGGFSRARENDHRLHLKRAIFDPLEGAPELISAQLGATGNLFIVQYVCQPLESFDQALTDIGASVHHLVPMHSRLVRMSPGLVEVARELDFVRSVLPYRAEYRIETPVLEMFRGEEGIPTQRYNVQVLEKGPALKAIVAQRIAGFGGLVDPLIPDGYLLQAELSVPQLVAVAALDEVVWIDRWSDFETDLNNVRIAGGANTLENQTGFTGQGVRGEVFDSNVRDSHVAFQSNPIIFHTNTAGDSDHGTKTTGCVFGDGTANANGRGLLPDAQPIFADFGQFTNRYLHTAELVQAPYFCVFQSNSFGNALTTQYTSISMEMDDIAFDFDLTICQSQSNTGNQLSRPQAWGKNIFSVGGIDHQNNSNLADDDWGGIASIGPAADGRIKPDICFWAENILCTDNETNTDYTTTFGGTSAATPCTAGHVGLAQQMWSEGIFGNIPSGSTVFERRCKATTARALIVNTATQYPFSGGSSDLTRTHQGWGLPDVQTMYDKRDETFFVDETDILLNLQSISYPLVVPAGKSEFKATLVYSDLPGTTSSNLHRINDLSLKVTSPGGTVFWGNNGLKTGNWSTSGGSSNTLDVIENVFVQSPQAGTWIVEVFADDVNVDGHVETPQMDADFALIVTGVEPGADGCPEPTKYCTGKLTSILTIPDIGHNGSSSIGANSFEITVLGGVPNQFSIVFWSDTANNAPLFGGTLCVQPPLVRGDTIMLDGTGAAQWPIDISGRTPGDHEFFQVWMRDPSDPTGFAVGLSDGLDVTYCD